MLSYGLEQHKENQARKVLVNLLRRVLLLVLSSSHYKTQELLILVDLRKNIICWGRHKISYQ